MPSDRLASYEPMGFWDEAFSGRGEVRPHYSAVLDALTREDLDARRAALVEEMEADGVVFAGAGGVRPFLLDPVPRVIGADEWTLLETGIVQRMRALNAFVADVYGDRRIVWEGVVPPRVVDEAEYHEPLLAGVQVRHDAWATVAGLDLVRGADGRFAVLEDNLRTPSGVAYALAAREKVWGGLARPAPREDGEPLGQGDQAAGAGGEGTHYWREAAREVAPLAPLPAPRPVDPLAFELLGEALRDAAPEGVDEPFVVLLSDGPGNSAWWEHRVLGERLGVPIVTLADLERRGAELVACLDGGKKGVDVVYRRTDVDRLAVGDELTAVGEALLEPWREGRIGVANAFGTGVADDKLAHAYVEAMIDFYLGESPVLPSVPTYRYIEGAWLACTKRSGIGRFNKNPPTESLEFPVDRTWRYQGGGTAGRDRCDPVDPQCGTFYGNYAYPSLTEIDQNPDLPDRPGVMPRTVAFTSSTTGVQAGAVARGLVLEGTDVSRLDEMGYADDNASCGTPRRVRWRLVDANTTGTGQRLIGWSPEVLAENDPKSKGPRC